MKKLLRQISTGALVLAVSYSFGQINVAFDNTPTTINDDGTLDNPIIITLSNIPNGTYNVGTATGVTINSRVYDAGTTISGGGHVASYSAATDFNLDETDPDIDTATLKTVTTLNTPSSGFFTRVYTIKKYPALTGSITSADIGIRFVGATGAGLTFVQTKETGGNANNATFRLNTNLSVQSLSARDFNISKSIYPNPVISELTISKDIKSRTYKVTNLLGNVVKEVAANGRLNVSELSSGIYVLVTDAGVAKFVKK
ncbi:T9SS type A sorting domain-containing protein [Seonamhaeicola marinus]|nr:T9SS type A sorting domain-containing protein [Seonamhaeicola marinus]